MEALEWSLATQHGHPMVLKRGKLGFGSGISAVTPMASLAWQCWLNSGTHCTQWHSDAGGPRNTRVPTGAAPKGGGKVKNYPDHSFAGGEGGGALHWFWGAGSGSRQ